MAKIHMDDRGKTDAELMRSIRDGNPADLQPLMDRHWLPIVRYTARMLGSVDDAKDVAQDVFLRIWEHRKRWTPGGSVSTYLYQIARNRVLHRLRHQRIVHQAEPEVVRRARQVPTPSDLTIEQELQSAFAAALGAMPERRREAFILVRYEGFSINETAGIMGVARRTVINHVHMATNDLREVLRPFVT